MNSTDTELDLSPFRNKHYLNLLFALYDAIEEPNVFLTRKDLLAHPRYMFNNKALDDALLFSRNKKDNKFVQTYEITNPNKVISYALTSKGLNFVYGIKIMELYAEYCDYPKNLYANLDALKNQYDEKSIIRARILGDEDATKLDLDLHEQELNDNQKRTVKESIRNRLKGMYLKGNKRYLVDNEETLRSINNGSDDDTVRIYGSVLKKTDESPVTVYTRLEGKTLIIDADNETTITYQDVRDYRDKDVSTLILCNNIRKIGASSFPGWNIKNVFFSDNLIKIGRHAFEHCYYLERIECFGTFDYKNMVPRSIAKNHSVRIGIYAFNGTPIGNKNEFGFEADIEL